MAFKTFNRLLYFAVETNEGEVGTFDNSTSYLEVTDPTFTVTNRTFDRTPTRLSITPAPMQIPGTGSASGAASATIEFSFSVELAGSGTRGTPARWGSLLQACGLSQTVVSTNAIDGVMQKGDLTPAGYTGPLWLRNYENFSTGTVLPISYAAGDNVGRVIGDTFYDDTTLFFDPDAAGASIANNDSLPGQVLDIYATSAGASTPTAAVAWVPVSTTNLGGADATSSSLSLRQVLNSSGDYIEGIGCRGNVEFAFVSGDRVMMNFTFQGVFNGYTESHAYTPTAEGRPIPPSFVGVSLGIGETTYGVTDTGTFTDTIFSAMTISLGNELVVREDVSVSNGYDACYITGRTPTMTFNPDAVRDFSSNPYADLWDRFLSGETTRGRLTVGGDSGNKFTFKFPAAQFSGISEGNRDEVVVWDSTTTLTGGDFGSSVQERAEGADSTVLNPRLGTDNEIVIYQL
tara:strand:- start:28721 stop:30100 length:1380 start_codon:yes stop_codon:yes gene_type:complete